MKSYAAKVKNALKEYRRVLKITRKPDRDEFEMSAKVTGAGIMIIGAIGFVIYMAATLISNSGV